MLKGVQILRHVYLYYRTNADLGVQHTIEDLMAVKFQGDAKLRQFLNSFRETLMAIPEKLPEKLVEQMFVTQLEKSEKLKLDINYYKRVDKDHPDRSRAFLTRRAWAIPR